MQISAVIIVKNAEQTIRRTLDSLKQFDEVIVFDTGSIDSSPAIAQEYANVKFFNGEFIGYGKSKNLAAGFASNEWILSIDADEVIAPELMDSITNLQPMDDAVYRFKRNNYYRNKKINYCGWGKEFVVRIYNKNKSAFNDKLVHEFIEPNDAKVITLKGELKHYSYHSISNFVTKRDVYSELFAIENTGKRKSSPFMAFIRGVFDFINTFIVKRGFLDGYRGLLIAVSNANVSFFKYLKLYEYNTCNNVKVSLIVKNCNHEKELNTLLNSAAYQSVQPDEIVVLIKDNNVKMQTFVESYSKKSFVPIIHVVDNQTEDTLNFEKQVIGQSKANYIVYINGPCILHKDFVRDHALKAKPGQFIKSHAISLNWNKYSTLLDSDIQEQKHFYGNIISRKYFGHLKSIVGLFLSTDNKVQHKIHAIYSFYKHDFINSINKNNENCLDYCNSKLFHRRSGLKLYRLFFSGNYYKLKESERPKIIVCLDRLKLLNCGLGQVALNFGRELLEQNNNEFEINFLLPSKGFSEFETKIKTIKQNLIKSIYPRYMKKYALCHVTHQLPSFRFGESRQNILTIHDLNFIFTKSKRKSRRYINSLQSNINKSDAIVFISEFTKEITYKYMKIPDNKIVKVIHNGVKSPVNHEKRPEWLPDKKYVFSIGQFLEKKNFHVLLPFIKLLPDEYFLVIAGENKTNYGLKMEQMALKLGINKRVIFPGGIDENEKGFLFNHCEAFLFPSIAEGFGLPVIEAMLCSKPVFCSNRTSLNEIGGDFAFFWKNFEPEQMLEVFEHGLNTFKLDRYMEKQIEYANYFTYKKNVKEYINLYNEMVF